MASNGQVVDGGILCNLSLDRPTFEKLHNIATHHVILSSGLEEVQFDDPDSANGLENPVHRLFPKASFSLIIRRMGSSIIRKSIASFGG